MAPSHLHSCPGDRVPDAQTSHRQDAGSTGAAWQGAWLSPVQPVDVGDTDHLEEGEEDDVQGDGLAVEDLEPVAPGLQREAGGRDEAGQAGCPCTRTASRLVGCPGGPRSSQSLPVCSSPPPPALGPGTGGQWGWPERAVRVAGSLLPAPRASASL